ncbi:MAG: adenylate/guanylate cyclase domain-containing protein [Gammaproteobacteria bacterium]|nr:adenylate/guanylate cyclase domain-containing protein [Gammaproteobacteria bacterium]
MADDRIDPLTGHDKFDSMIASFADETDPDKAEAIRQDIWDRFGTHGTVLISDMASFSSTSRKLGVCHFLKLIHRARQLVGPVVQRNNGTLIKCDADNCYAFFKEPDDAINASFDISAALYELNDAFGIAEQIFLSMGIDYGRVLLIDDVEFYGDPVNTASKLGEDLAVRAETLITERTLERASFEAPELAERMVARISEIEIKYIRLPMTESSKV